VTNLNWISWSNWSPNCFSLTRLFPRNYLRVRDSFLNVLIVTFFRSYLRKVILAASKNFLYKRQYQTHSLTYTSTHTHTHTHTHTNIHAHTHTNIHAHPLARNNTFCLYFTGTHSWLYSFSSSTLQIKILTTHSLSYNYSHSHLLTHTLAYNSQVDEFLQCSSLKSNTLKKTLLLSHSNILLNDLCILLRV